MEAFMIFLWGLRLISFLDSFYNLRGGYSSGGYPGGLQVIIHLKSPGIEILNP